VQGTHPDDLSIPPIDTSEELEVFSLLLFDENSLEGISCVLNIRKHVFTYCIL
jgi:hypothetical protein